MFYCAIATPYQSINLVSAIKTELEFIDVFLKTLVECKFRSERNTLPSKFNHYQADITYAGTSIKNFIKTCTDQVSEKCSVIVNQYTQIHQKGLDFPKNLNGFDENEMIELSKSEFDSVLAFDHSNQTLLGYQKSMEISVWDFHEYKTLTDDLEFVYNFYVAVGKFHQLDVEVSKTEFQKLNFEKSKKNSSLFLKMSSSFNQG